MTRGAWAGLAIGYDHLPIIDTSRGAVLTREDAVSATEAANELGAVALAVPVPGVRDGYLVYIRENGWTVILPGADVESVATAVTALRQLARKCSG